MLALRNVYAGYGAGDVVKDVSITINANENLAIIGPNGCGKTTLLRAISGLLPFRGEIDVLGTSLNKMKPREAARRIAMLSQSSGAYFSYTVYETVMMGRYLHMNNKLLGLPSGEDKGFVTHCLEAVDLLNEKDREITKLSGGQLQRVFLARTLAQNPDIILLDEPTNHLDLKYQLELIEYLKEWSRQGRRAVVGVLHDMNLAMRLGDAVLVMKDGEALAQGKTGETITKGLLREAFSVDVAAYMTDALRPWEGMGE